MAIISQFGELSCSHLSRLYNRGPEKTLDDLSNPLYLRTAEPDEIQIQCTLNENEVQYESARENSQDCDLIGKETSVVCQWTVIFNSSLSVYQ